MDLQTRVTNILTKPKEEWPVIAAEATDVATLYKTYVAILAAIPPIGSFIGMTFVGVSVPLLGTYRFGLGQGITGAIVQYVFALAGVYIAAVVVDNFAPKYQSQPSQIQALKLVAYSSTPGWLAGALSVIPVLGTLAVLAGLYGIYLCYLGVSPTMKTPPDKVVPYLIVSAIAIIVVTALMGFLTSSLTGSMFAGPRIGL